MTTEAWMIVSLAIAVIGTPWQIDIRLRDILRKLAQIEYDVLPDQHPRKADRPEPSDIR